MAECAEASDSEAQKEKKQKREKQRKRYSKTEGETHTGQNARIFPVSQVSEEKPAPTRTLFWIISALLV